MIKDLPDNTVEDVSIAVVLQDETPESKLWHVYLVNEKDSPLKTVFISSKGYGYKDGIEVKTTTLRHFIGDVDAKKAIKIEAIDTAVFGLTNEYLLSYYIEDVIYDKKYIFLPESIVDDNFVKVPLVDKPGVIIGGNK
ncbi:hypothetical protein ORI89_17115 [Sphingobacterium sp. UT-1RO-CII-1]|uniref:hypothetical protein n=1 Tax=Sphingobacterium sp. UT-1RO-CII-1 TaxID=2995225 RepID=UPI00227B8AAF|nr:hypothetical protein [Sphingobacterium sp. UT-1RO-CII-1]MCY4781382.1 hypothetical protein [Sphingobacterium sp. UT-1RO-CII-1]